MYHFNSLFLMLKRLPNIIHMINITNIIHTTEGYTLPYDVISLYADYRRLKLITVFFYNFIPNKGVLFSLHKQDSQPMMENAVPRGH